LVHGVGKVGSTVAEILQNAGHNVFTYDLLSDRADVRGCVNISESQSWWRARGDVLILCSGSYLITEEIACKLDFRTIVSGANCPFASNRVGEILSSRDIVWVPDVVTNAGAVICDSIEHYAPTLFREIDPESIYYYVQSLIAEKTAAFLECRNKTELSPDMVLAQLLDNARSSICGTEFRGWLERAS
jgi:leucine dehydrogenase